MADAAVMYLCGASETECRASQLPESIRSLIFDARLYARPAVSEAARVVLQTMHEARVCIWSNVIIYSADTRTFHTALHSGRAQHEEEVRFVPGGFVEWAQKCSKSMLGVALDIVWEKTGHANMLIIDRSRRQIEHFEPHGEQIMGALDDAANAHLREDVQALMTEVGFAGYTYIQPSQVCPTFAVIAAPGGASKRLGIQGFLNAHQPRSKMAGTCALWSLWYLHVRLQNPQDSPDEALRKAMSMATNLADAMPVDRTTERCSQWLLQHEQLCDPDFVPTSVNMQLAQKLCQPSCTFMRSLREGGRTLEEFIVRFTERLVALVNIHLANKYYCKCDVHPINVRSVGYSNALEAMDECGAFRCGVVAQTVAQTGDGRVISFVGEHRPLTSSPSASAAPSAPIITPSAPPMPSAPSITPSAPPADLSASAMFGQFAVVPRSRRTPCQAARLSKVSRRSKRLSRRKRSSSRK